MDKFKNSEELNLSYPREIGVFKRFLKERVDITRGDLDSITNRYQIEKEKLESIKNKIREILGSESIEYISTTIHLRPRAIDYLKFGYERINQAVGDSKKIFYYPVYYQEYESERPDLIYLGNYSFSLCDVIPNFKEKTKNREFKISLDFHLALMNYLLKEGWEEEISQNIDKFLNKEFSNFKAQFRNIFIEKVKDTVISLLRDYKDFMVKSGLNEITEEIIEINKKLASLILENLETLTPILKKIDLKKEYLEDIKDGRTKIITGDFIFIICVLGNLNHIGAEYGKFNQIRANLDLPELLDPPSPQERFKFFEIEGEKRVENDTLRFLFGSAASFSYVAKYEGWEDMIWNPIDEISRRRIRIIDFYLKLREFLKNKDDYLESMNFEEFNKIIETINYFIHLKNEEELSFCEKIKEEIEKSYKDEDNIKEWILRWNEKAKNINPRLKIIDKIFLQKLVSFIFKNYVEGEFKILKETLPEKLSNHFLKTNLEKIEKFEELNKELGEKLFYGIKLPVILNLDKEDLIKINALIEITQKDFEAKITQEVFQFIL
ncbi:MAG: hypothetical protein KatS3mg095_0695 [Candidatus Parcubacteria bacterium]|nr:MAG: hypothetical protein KatS3mg095_0695 [Candidatus Parcubacteria bacterium]